MYGELPRADGIRQANAAQSVVRFDVETRQPLRRDRRCGGARRRSPRQLSPEIGPHRDRLCHGGVAIGGDVRNTQLRAEGVGQRDPRRWIATERAREIDLRAIELIGGNHQLARSLGELGLGTRYVDRRTHACLRLRHRETDELGGECGIGLSRRDDGLRARSPGIGQRHGLCACLHRRRSIGARRGHLALGRADTAEVGEVEQRFGDACTPVIHVERRHHRWQAQTGEIEAEGLGIEVAIDP